MGQLKAAFFPLLGAETRPCPSTSYLARACALILLSVVFTSCTYTRQKRSVPVGLSASTSSSFKAAMKVISDNCITCHQIGKTGRDFSGMLSSEAGWVAAGLVSQGSAQGSQLYQYLQGSGLYPATMPLGSPSLSSADRETIRSWIDGMGATAPEPSPLPTVDPGTRFGAAMQVIRNNCIACHGPGGAAPLDFTPYLGSESSWVAAGIVAAGNPQGSKLFQALQGSGLSPADMPYGRAPLAAADLSAIRDWISQMPAAGSSPTPGPSFNPAFACNAGASAIVPSSVRRIAKLHYINSISEFLSRLSAGNLTAVMAAIQPNLNLIPEDAGSSYARNDTSLTQAHASAVFDTAYALGTLLAGNSAYANQLAKACGSTATQASLTGSCASTFIAYYGRKAFRRPLTAAEITDLGLDPASTAVPQAALNLTTTSGLTTFLVRLLAHPRFFYRLDNEGTRTSGTDGMPGATYQLSKYELLSKITFLYWDAPPTDALYDQVASLDLSQVPQLQQVVGSVLADARARNGVGNFYQDWLKIQKIPQLDSMNSKSYATFAQGENINVAGHDHRKDMIQEILDMTAYYTFSVNGRYEDLLTSPYSFAKTTDLANLYGMSTVWDGTSAGLARFPASQPRSGLLTRAAFLVSGTEYTDPIIKGKNIRFNLLCNVLPPPPPTVDIVPVRQDPHTSTRMLVERATAGTAANPNQCLQCHGLMNPLGFISESYDSLGRFRNAEKKFDAASGAFVDSVPVSTQALPNLFSGDSRYVSDAVDFSSYLADTGVGHQCMVRQYFRYAFGRDEDESRDGCSLENMRVQLMNKTDGTLLKMLGSTPTQQPFRYRQVQ